MVGHWLEHKDMTTGEGAFGDGELDGVVSGECPGRLGRAINFASVQE